MALDPKFLSDETGATAIQYGLIAAGISPSIVAIVKGAGAGRIHLDQACAEPGREQR